MFKALSMCPLSLALLVSLVLPVQGVILVTGINDDPDHLSAPDAPRNDIFNSVARVVNGSGTGEYGSAVHLRGKYMLSARHVDVHVANHVTFDGVTIYERDASFAPVFIGTSDLQLFKLVEDPGLNEVKLFDGADGDIPYPDPESEETIHTTATIVGYGRGRDPGDPGGDTIWSWGSNDATIAKRWGVNRIEGNVDPVTYNSKGVDYSFDALWTSLEVSSGSDEAAVCVYDSGCGLFVEHAGEWKLAAIAVTVTSISGASTSTFDDVTNDENYFVRIKTYASDIEAAIPDLTTYSGWKIDHGLYGAGANDDADTDDDGIPQLMEYALGSDPNAMSLDALPIQQLTEDSGSDYLELVVTRPIGLQGINYVPQTATDLGNWPSDSTGIANASPTPVDQGNGTEKLTYRRAATLASDDSAFIRLKVENSP